MTTAKRKHTLTTGRSTLGIEAQVDPYLPLVVVNPSSAGGKTGAAWKSMASDLATHFGPFRVSFTEKSGDAVQLARAAVNAGCRFVIACGGDGTMNEVANGILTADQDAELGLLPSGTGGDFRRSLNVPLNVRAAAHILCSGRTVKIDVGRVNYINHAGAADERYFLGIASFGFSGEVIRRTKRAPTGIWSSAFGIGGGKVAYAVATLETIAGGELTDVLVQIDGSPERRLSVTNFCVANGRYFGGGMKIAPDARLTDGLFDVIVVSELSPLKVLRSAHKLYRGTHTNMDEVGQMHARTVTARPLHADTVVLLDVDGELPGSLPARFEIIPQRLAVRVPQR